MKITDKMQCENIVASMAVILILTVTLLIMQDSFLDDFREEHRVVEVIR